MNIKAFFERHLTIKELNVIEKSFEIIQHWITSPLQFEICNY